MTNQIAKAISRAELAGTKPGAGRGRVRSRPAPRRARARRLGGDEDSDDVRAAAVRAERGENAYAYAYILPGFLFIGLATLVGVVYSLYISFTNYDGLTHFDQFDWVGLENYREVLFGVDFGTFWMVTQWTLVFAPAEHAAELRGRPRARAPAQRPAPPRAQPLPDAPDHPLGAPGDDHDPRLERHLQRRLRLPEPVPGRDRARRRALAGRRVLGQGLGPDPEHLARLPVHDDRLPRGAPVDPRRAERGGGRRRRGRALALPLRDDPAPPLRDHAAPDRHLRLPVQQLQRHLPADGRQPGGRRTPTPAAPTSSSRTPTS